MSGYQLKAHNVGNVMGDFKFSICSSTLGVYNTLRDPLTIKVRKQIDQMEVL